MILHIFIFLVSCLLLFGAGKLLVEALMGIARFLKWREFIVAFILVAFAASIPNLFVGINSALNKIPQLSFGDILGGNLIDLTLAVALATLFARELPAASKMVQTSAIFTMIIAILPLVLILDGTLSRIDGALLILVFFAYIFWLFSRSDRFTKAYDGETVSIVKGWKIFVINIGKVILGAALLILASGGVVKSASFFAQSFNLPLVLVGILIVGLGNAIPETYFALIAAKKSQNWLILGDLMGSVVVAATFVLGIVALIYPIEITDFSLLAVSRFFLIIAAVFFFFFVRSDRRLTVREALFLLSIYIVFVITEILIR